MALTKPLRHSIVSKASWLILLIPVALLVWKLPATAFEPAVATPPPVINEAAKPGTETAVFAGGCFWGVQGVFQHVNGVTRAVSGYTGGAKETAQYETVSTGSTGHAESVQITYDPKIVTYGQLLQVYFSVVTDPTELNYQGPDHGTQYRTTIFFQNPEQKKIAESYIAQLTKAQTFHDPIVTTLEPFKAFYPAEGYHQDFLTNNPHYPYIVVNDMPKVDNLKKVLPSLYREQPVLVAAQ